MLINYFFIASSLVVRRERVTKRTVWTFFAEDALPELSLGRVTKGQIMRLFEHSRHPDWPTDFG